MQPKSLAFYKKKLANKISWKTAEKVQISKEDMIMDHYVTMFCKVRREEMYTKPNLTNKKR